MFVFDTVFIRDQQCSFFIKVPIIGNEHALIKLMFLFLEKFSDCPSMNPIYFVSSSFQDTPEQNGKGRKSRKKLNDRKHLHISIRSPFFTLYLSPFYFRGLIDIQLKI